MDAIVWKKASIGYGHKVVLKNLSLTIKKGSFTLISGDNGSGKTTLIKTLEEKRLLLQGKLMKDTRLINNASYIAQKSAIHIYFPLSIEDTVAMGLYAKKGFIRSLRGVDEIQVQEMLSQLHLQSKKYQLLKECSGGELKKTLLARALIKQPDLLIMDEPFVNVDTSSSKVICDLLHKHNKERQMTVIVISHHKKLLKEYATTFVDIRDGQIYES